VAAGSLLLPYFMGNLAMKTLTTPLLRRFGFRRVLVVDGVIAMLAIPLCGWFAPQTHAVLLVAALILAGASRSMLMTALQTLSLVDVSPPQRASASTLSAVAMQIVIAGGITICTWVLTASRLVAERPEPMLGDFRMTLAMLCGLGLLAVPAYLRLSHDAGAAVSDHRPAGA